MIKKRRSLILIVAFAAFFAVLFINTNLKSNKLVPPAYYTNSPPQNMNCTYCHSGVASHDSTNFVLQIGTDSAAMSNVVSGVTTYTPGTQYFLRVRGIQPSPVYGFELTAQDSTNHGATVTNFGILDPVSTSLISVAYKFVAHHNANDNNQWTFTWTAPTTYQGLITFYYAGNDGVAGDTDQGDHIFLVQKKIMADASSGVVNIENKLNALSVFPTVFDQQIQIAFELKENAKVEGSVISLNGQVVKSIISEGLPAGSFNRSFDLSDLAAGVYLVKLQIGDAYTVRKIVKD